MPLAARRFPVGPKLMRSPKRDRGDCAVHNRGVKRNIREAYLTFFRKSSASFSVSMEGSQPVTKAPSGP